MITNRLFKSGTINLKNKTIIMLKLKTLLLSALVAFTFVSCSEEEEEVTDTNSSGSCTELLDQIAEGSFHGETFSFVEGTAEQDSWDENEYLIVLYYESVTGDACDSWNFGKPKKTIRMLAPKAVGVYEVKAFSGAAGVNFNDASVVNTVLATCGTLFIDDVSNGTLKGRVVASGSESDINGSFEVTLCQ